MRQAETTTTQLSVDYDGRAFRMLTALDEYTRECLAIRVARRLNSNDVLGVLAELFFPERDSLPHPQ